MMESKYAIELLENGKRIDGRKFDEFRKIVIEPNVIEKAEGSCRVRLGDTEVIAGVKMEIAEPFSDTPEEGILIVNAEFTPLASPDFESGPPSENAIELARVVDRGIRESKCINLEELCLIPKEKVWGVFVDIHIINHQGNLLDCAALAVLVALLNTKIPKVKNDEIVRGEFDKPLPMQFKPTTVTVCKIGDKFLIDPIFDEESVVETKISIAVREDNKICAIQKQGIRELSIGEIEKIIDIAFEKSAEIRKLAG